MGRLSIIVLRVISLNIVALLCLLKFLFFLLS